jgi:hypothetical protein
MCHSRDVCESCDTVGVDPLLDRASRFGVHIGFVLTARTSSDDSTCCFLFLAVCDLLPKLPRVLVTKEQSWICKHWFWTGVQETDSGSMCGLGVALLSATSLQSPACSSGSSITGMSTLEVALPFTFCVVVLSIAGALCYLLPELLRVLVTKGQRWICKHLFWTGVQETDSDYMCG